MAEAPRILKLWLRRVEGGPVEEQEVLRLHAGKGVVGDHTYGRMRHVTFLCVEDWETAGASLGVHPDPSLRRANVLLSGGNAGQLLKRRVRIGDVVVEIKGETAPCPVMEKAAVGMREALQQDTRAGVWARVLEGGELRQSMPLEILESATE